MVPINSSPEVDSVRGRLAFTSAAVVRASGHPAAWVFAALYGVSALTLVVTGNTPLLVVELGLAVLLTVLVLLTVAVTASSPTAAPTGERTVATSWRVWAQLGVLAMVVLVTLYGGMVVNGTAPDIPGLYQLVQNLYRLTPLALNPILYVLVPAILLLVLGARLRGLGFAPGRHSWAVSGLWSIYPVIVIGIALLTGGLSVLRLVGLLVSNTLQNGPMEEFLWRGAVLTRLRLVVGTPWSVVVSSLVFGIWHIGANLHAFDGQVAAAVAYSVVSQATIGLAFALLFVCTRNLLAPSIAHVLINVAGELLG
jgi:membrane protease YdiL (CAAX protease family)